MGQSWKGRVEDQRLVTGRGAFVDDMVPPDALAAVFVRSPHAHARILGFDVSVARAAPGVIDILTAADMQAAGVTNVSVPPPLPGRDGRKLIVPHRLALAGERVLHVGDPVALVVAETR